MATPVSIFSPTTALACCKTTSVVACRNYPAEPTPGIGEITAFVSREPGNHVTPAHRDLLGRQAEFAQLTGRFGDSVTGMPFGGGRATRGFSSADGLR